MKKLRHLLGDWTSYVFILPAVIVLGLFMIYPIIWSFLASFKEIQPLMLRDSALFNVPGELVWFEQYKTVINDPLFIKALFNTLYFGVLFVPITMVASAALAILLDQKLKGVNFVRSVLFIPYIISVVSASLIFMFLFNGDRGLVNALLYKFELDGPNWLGSTIWAMPVIVLMTCWQKIGYFMLIYLAGLQNIPNELYEAADVDGATSFQKFRLITRPLLSRISLVVFVLLLMDALNIFQEIFVMTGGGPANSTITIPFLIYNEAFKYFQIGPAAAMSYLLFIFVIGITLFHKKMVDKRLD